MSAIAEDTLLERHGKCSRAHIQVQPARGMQVSGKPWMGMGALTL